MAIRKRKNCWSWLRSVVAPRRGSMEGVCFRHFVECLSKASASIRNVLFVWRMIFETFFQWWDDEDEEKKKYKQMLRRKTILASESSARNCDTEHYHLQRFVLSSLPQSSSVRGHRDALCSSEALFLTWPFNQHRTWSFSLHGIRKFSEKQNCSNLWMFFDFI